MPPRPRGCRGGRGGGAGSENKCHHDRDCRKESLVRRSEYISHTHGLWTRHDVKRVPESVPTTLTKRVSDSEHFSIVNLRTLPTPLSLIEQNAERETLISRIFGKEGVDGRWK